MTTTVFLVRHASHDRLGRVLCGRMAGVTLSDEGLAQARRVADRLAGEGLAAVYASPLERAVSTARPIALAAGVEPRIDDALNEIDFGDWTGAAFEDLERDDRNEERTRHVEIGDAVTEHLVCGCPNRDPKCHRQLELHRDLPFPFSALIVRPRLEWRRTPLAQRPRDHVSTRRMCIKK